MDESKKMAYVSKLYPRTQKLNSPLVNPALMSMKDLRKRAQQITKRSLKEAKKSDPELELEPKSGFDQATIAQKSTKVVGKQPLESLSAVSKKLLKKRGRKPGWSPMKGCEGGDYGLATFLALDNKYGYNSQLVWIGKENGRYPGAEFQFIQQGNTKLKFRYYLCKKCIAIKAKNREGLQGINVMSLIVDSSTGHIIRRDPDQVHHLCMMEEHKHILDSIIPKPRKVFRQSLAKQEQKSDGKRDNLVHSGQDALKNGQNPSVSQQEAVGSSESPSKKRGRPAHIKSNPVEQGPTISSPTRKSGKHMASEKHDPQENGPASIQYLLKAQKPKTPTRISPRTAPTSTQPSEVINNPSNRINLRKDSERKTNPNFETGFESEAEAEPDSQNSVDDQTSPYVLSAESTRAIGALPDHAQVSPRTRSIPRTKPMPKSPPKSFNPRSQARISTEEGENLSKNPRISGELTDRRLSESFRVIPSSEANVSEASIVPIKPKEEPEPDSSSKIVQKSFKSSICEASDLPTSSTDVRNGKDDASHEPPELDFVYRMDLSSEHCGYKPEHCQVSFDHGFIEIQTEQIIDNGVESHKRSFYRRRKIPEGIDADTLIAEFEEPGILVITGKKFKNRVEKKVLNINIRRV